MCGREDEKSVVIAYLLLVSVGVFGGHHFYLRRYIYGLCYLATFGLFGIGFLTDIVRLPFLVEEYNDNMFDADEEEETRSLEDAYILWFPCGLLGFHHFYLGNFTLGFLYLITFGVYGIGWIIDAFRIPSLVTNSNLPSEDHVKGHDQATAHLIALSPLGLLGAQHYYLRRWKWGLFYTFTCGAFTIGWLLDMIRAPSLVSRENKRLQVPEKERIHLDDVYLLWASFGIVGAHHYFLGRKVWAAVYLCTFGLFGVGWLADIFRIPCLVMTCNNHIGKEDGFYAPEIYTADMDQALQPERQQISHKDLSFFLTRNNNAFSDDEMVDHEHLTFKALEQALKQLPPETGHKQVQKSLKFAEHTQVETFQLDQDSDSGTQRDSETSFNRDEDSCSIPYTSDGRGGNANEKKDNQSKIIDSFEGETVGYYLNEDVFIVDVVTPRGMVSYEEVNESINLKVKQDVAGNGVSKNSNNNVYETPDAAYIGRQQWKPEKAEELPIKKAETPLSRSSSVLVNGLHSTRNHFKKDTIETIKPEAEMDDGINYPQTDRCIKQKEQNISDAKTTLPSKNDTEIRNTIKKHVKRPSNAVLDPELELLKDSHQGCKITLPQSNVKNEQHHELMHQPMTTSVMESGVVQKNAVKRKSNRTQVFKSDHSMEKTIVQTLQHKPGRREKVAVSELGMNRKSSQDESRDEHHGVISTRLKVNNSNSSVGSFTPVDNPKIRVHTPRVTCDTGEVHDKVDVDKNNLNQNVANNVEIGSSISKRKRNRTGRNSGRVIQESNKSGDTEMVEGDKTEQSFQLSHNNQHGSPSSFVNQEIQNVNVGNRTGNRVNVEVIPTDSINTGGQSDAQLTRTGEPVSYATYGFVNTAARKSNRSTKAVTVPLAQMMSSDNESQEQTIQQPLRMLDNRVIETNSASVNQSRKRQRPQKSKQAQPKIENAVNSESTLKRNMDILAKGTQLRGTESMNQEIETTKLRAIDCRTLVRNHQNELNDTKNVLSNSISDSVSRHDNLSVTENKQRHDSRKRNNLKVRNSPSSGTADGEHLVHLNKSIHGIEDEMTTGSIVHTPIKTATIRTTASVHKEQTTPTHSRSLTKASKRVTASVHKEQTVSSTSARMSDVTNKMDETVSPSNYSVDRAYKEKPTVSVSTISNDSTIKSKTIISTSVCATDVAKKMGALSSNSPTEENDVVRQKTQVLAEQDNKENASIAGSNMGTSNRHRKNIRTVDALRVSDRIARPLPTGNVRVNTKSARKRTVPTAQGDNIKSGTSEPNVTKHSDLISSDHRTVETKEDSDSKIVESNQKQGQSSNTMGQGKSSRNKMRSSVSSSYTDNTETMVHDITGTSQSKTMAHDSTGTPSSIHNRVTSSNAAMVSKRKKAQKHQQTTAIVMPESAVPKYEHGITDTQNGTTESDPAKQSTRTSKTRTTQQNKTSVRYADAVNMASMETKHSHLVSDAKLPSSQSVVMETKYLNDSNIVMVKQNVIEDTSEVYPSDSKPRSRTTAQDNPSGTAKTRTQNKVAMGKNSASYHAPSTRTTPSECPVVSAAANRYSYSAETENSETSVRNQHRSSHTRTHNSNAVDLHNRSVSSDVQAKPGSQKRSSTSSTKPGAREKRGHRNKSSRPPTRLSDLESNPLNWYTNKANGKYNNGFINDLSSTLTQTSLNTSGVKPSLGVTVSKSKAVTPKSETRSDLVAGTGIKKPVTIWSSNVYEKENNEQITDQSKSRQGVSVDMDIWSRGDQSLPQYYSHGGVLDTNSEIRNENDKTKFSQNSLGVTHSFLNTPISHSVNNGKSKINENPDVSDRCEIASNKAANKHKPPKAKSTNTGAKRQHVSRTADMVNKGYNAFSRRIQKIVPPALPKGLSPRELTMCQEWDSDDDIL